MLRLTCALLLLAALASALSTSQSQRNATRPYWTSSVPTASLIVLPLRLSHFRPPGAARFAFALLCPFINLARAGSAKFRELIILVSR